MDQRNKNQFNILAYKLLGDILFLWTLAVFGLLIIQNILPNYFFSSFSLAKVIFIFLIILFFIGFFGKKIDSGFFSLPEEKEKTKTQKAVLILLIIFSFFLIVNSFRNLNISFWIPTAFFGLLVFFLLLQTLTKKEDF